MPTVSKPRLLIAGSVLLATAAIASATAPIGGSQEVGKDGGTQAATKALREVLSRVNPVYPAALKEKKISLPFRMITMTSEVFGLLRNIAGDNEYIFGPRDKAPQINPAVLRNTFVRNLLNKDVKLIRIYQILGWQDIIKMTLYLQLVKKRI